jgi:hypothetical protein
MPKRATAGSGDQPPAYQASQIRCHRLTKAEVEARREARVHRGQTRANQRMGFTDPADQASDTRSRGFGDVSVELDAIEPNRLRALVQEAIERHLQSTLVRHRAGMSFFGRIRNFAL